MRLQDGLRNAFDTIVVADSWQMQLLCYAAMDLFVQRAAQLPSSELGELVSIFIRAHAPGQYDCGTVARSTVDRAFGLRAAEILADAQLFGALTTTNAGSELMVRLAKILAIQLELKHPRDDPDFMLRASRAGGWDATNNAAWVLAEDVASKVLLDRYEPSSGYPSRRYRYPWDAAKAVPWPSTQPSFRNKAAGRSWAPSSSLQSPDVSSMRPLTRGSPVGNAIASSSRAPRPRRWGPASGRGRGHRAVSNELGNSDSEDEFGRWDPRHAGMSREKRMCKDF